MKRLESASQFVMRLLSIAAVAALSLAITPITRASDPEPPPSGASGVNACIAAAAGAVQRRYESVRDLQADFVQTSRSVALGSMQGSQTSSSGRVVIAKPGRMRWSYEKPAPSLVVSDGSTLWIYDPAFREAQKLAVTEGYLSAAGVQFLLGVGDMRDEFVVTSTSCSEQEALLELVPRKPATYERLRILTNPSTGDVQQTTVVDLFGNVTQVDFTSLEVNQDPEPELFVFDPGDNVRVIELPGNGS